VVASEVRSLAQRSAGAAKEIKQLISESVNKVEHGSRLVGDAGSTMDEIVASVKRVSDMMSDISDATREQSSGIEQVNEAITQMDTVTQQNASLVEESAAAAASMQKEARELGTAVAVFKLAEIKARPAAHSAKSVAPRLPAAERREPTRAKNVARLPLPAKAAPRAPATAVKSGTDDWSEF
jgi:methyl-accepting chemotaxis protein